MSEGINTLEKNDRLRGFTESMERSFLNQESKVLPCASFMSCWQKQGES